MPRPFFAMTRVISRRFSSSWGPGAAQSPAPEVVEGLSLHPLATSPPLSLCGPPSKLAFDGLAAYRRSVPVGALGYPARGASIDEACVFPLSNLAGWGREISYVAGPPSLRRQRIGCSRPSTGGVMGRTVRAAKVVFVSTALEFLRRCRPVNPIGPSFHPAERGALYWPGPFR